LYSIASATVAANVVNEDGSVTGYMCEDAIALVGVYDGHGGGQCSKFVTESILATAMKVCPTSPGEDPTVDDLEDTLKATYAELDRRFFSLHGTSCKTVGTCALTLLLTSEVLVIGNVGDSRAVLCHLGPDGTPHVKVLTTDHDTTNVSELSHIAQRTTDKNPVRRAQIHANVSAAPTRVAGSLMVTRSIGDGYLKDVQYSMAPYNEHLPYITSEPEISVYPVGLRDAFVVLCSDGLHNMLSNEEIVSKTHALLQRGAAVSSVPLSLIQEALVEKVGEPSRRSLDDIMAIPLGRRRQLHDDTTVCLVVLNPHLYPAAPQGKGRAMTITPPLPPLCDSQGGPPTPLVPPNLCKRERSSKPDSPKENPLSHTPPHLMTVGARVRARWQRGVMWCDGVVVSVAKDGASVTIRYDDGDIESGVRCEDVMRPLEAEEDNKPPMSPLSQPFVGDDVLLTPPIENATRKKKVSGAGNTKKRKV